jgi:long-subunit fatty acid transport protein
MSFKFGAASLAFALSTTTALAGGLDRSGQSIGFIFETGNVVELSYGSVSPSVNGVSSANFANRPSGDIAPSYGIAALSMKSDLNDKFSVGLLLDQPYGAHVSYETAGYPLNTANAKVNSTSITLMGRYKLTDAIAHTLAYAACQPMGFMILLLSVRLIMCRPTQKIVTWDILSALHMKSQRLHYVWL